MLTVTPAAQDKLGELLTDRDGPESMIRVWVDPSNGHAPYGMMLVSAPEPTDTVVENGPVRLVDDRVGLAPPPLGDHAFEPGPGILLGDEVLLALAGQVVAAHGAEGQQRAQGHARAAAADPQAGHDLLGGHRAPGDVE